MIEKKNTLMRAASPALNGDGLPHRTGVRHQYIPIGLLAVWFICFVSVKFKRKRGVTQAVNRGPWYA